MKRKTRLTLEFSLAVSTSYVLAAENDVLLQRSVTIEILITLDTIGMSSTNLVLDETSMRSILLCGTWTKSTCKFYLLILVPDDAGDKNYTILVVAVVVVVVIKLIVSGHFC